MEENISIIKIKSKLNTEFIGNKINYYPVLDSTNLTAKNNPQEPDGTVFITECQLKGRGRLSREWSSESSTGIYMSILLKPHISTSSISQITLIAGLATAKALNMISKEKTYIKWPNDCIINNKKVCGILTELAITENQSNNVIVGIGVNVNNSLFTAELKDKATSLSLENNTHFDISEIIILILSEFEKYYIKFLNHGFESLINDYSHLCITLGREVEIIAPSDKYKAKAIGIDSEGGLIIDKNGNSEIINSGEVSVRGILGYV